MTWAPFALAVVFGLVVSAGIYFTVMWPEVAPADDDEDEDAGDGAHDGARDAPGDREAVDDAAGDTATDADAAGADPAERVDS